MNKILDIEKIRQQLDEADIYEDYDGNKIQTIYIGDVRDMTPSGKVYMPFACSNLTPCERCKGKGYIKNKNGQKKKYEQTLRKLKSLQSTENEKLITKLLKQQWQWKPTKVCTECCGLGSLETRLDQDYWEQLQSELDEINAWHHLSDDDGCDVMVSREAIEYGDN